MRIVILVPLFPPNWLGGTEIATYNIASHLAKKGHEVHVVTSFDPDMPKKEESDGFSTHRIKRINLPMLKTLSYSVGALRRIKKINPDIVHAQFIFMGFHAMLSKAIFNIPYIVYARGSDVYHGWPLKRLFSKKIIKRADYLIALTSDMKNELRNTYKREISVIPNGIESDRIKPYSKSNVRLKLKINHDEEILLFVGSLRAVKGVNYLIKAMVYIVRNRERVKLIIIGDGSERKRLEMAVHELGLEDRAIFMGAVQNDKVLEYMRASDIFVLPSLSEGFPNVVLEAMASGLPVVCTDVRGMKEIVTDGSNGFLVQPRNPSEIAEKITLLLNDEKLRNEISDQNREDVKQYSWDVVTEKLEKIYREVA